MTMNRRIFLFGVALPLAAQEAMPWKKGSGWKALFTGRDARGWHGVDTESIKGASEWFTAAGARLDAGNAKALSSVAAPGGVLLNGPKGKTVNLATDESFGDCELYIEFLVSKGSNSGVYLQGLYEIQVFDSYGVTDLKTSDCGAIYHRWIDGKPVGGSVPKVNACLKPGEWQSFHAWFRAPRFDAAGKKTANARFERVLLNGKVVQENVSVEGGTRSHMPIAEATANPLMLQGDHGPVAYRNAWIRPLK